METPYIVDLTENTHNIWCFFVLTRGSASAIIGLRLCKSALHMPGRYTDAAGDERNYREEEYVSGSKERRRSSGF